MKRKDYGFKICLIALTMFAAIVIFGNLVDMKIPEEHAANAKYAFGILLGVAFGSGLSNIINGFKNNKLDQKLWDEMKLEDKIEVTKENN